MNESFLDHLEGIIGLLNRIAKHLENLSQEEFLDDQLRIDAVTLNLVRVSAAYRDIARQYPSFNKEHPQLAWKAVSAIEEHLYGNLDIDNQWIWRIATTLMPRQYEILKSFALI